MVDTQAHTPESHSAGGHLDRQLFHGIAWTAVLRWVAQFFSWIGTFYAAHLLAPGDYGVVAMAVVPIGFFRVVEEFGLDAVLVQNRGLGDLQYARLAGLALLIGAGLAALFLALALPIANFNHEPIVAALVSALSVCFLLDALQILPRASLQRALRFRALAAVLAVQFLSSSITLVICARLGLGPWALVLNTIAGGVIATAILIRLAPFAVAWPRELATIAQPVLAGWRMLISRIGWYGYSSGDQFLIGRVLGKDALGAYGFAMSFAGLPIQEITSVVSRVVPGIFSEVQSSRGELRRYFLLLTEAMAYLAMPAAIGLALTADRVVHIALGPQWGAVVLPLRLLSLYFAFYAAQVLVSHVLVWTGHFRANMWFTLLGCAGLLTGFALTVKSGIVAVAWSWIAVFPLVSFPPVVFAARILQLKLRELFAVLLPATIACVVMSVVVIAVRRNLSAGLTDIPALAVESASGAVTYMLVLALFYRRRVLAILRTAFSKPV